MYSFHKVKIWNIKELFEVSEILYKCGKDMAVKYDLHHWDNPHIKNWIIVLFCVLKNDIYLVRYGKIPVATFQTRKVKTSYLFQKLATLPEFSGLGIGSMCLNEIERLAKKEKCTDIICEVYEKSENARAFYVHRGYTMYGVADTLKYNELKLRKNLMRKEKKVLVVGAGFLQDFVIRKAKSMGYETLAVDSNPKAVGFEHADKYAVIDIVDEKACLEYAKSEKVDGVLTAATDYGVLTAAYIAQEMNLAGLDYDVAKLIKNKYRVRKRLYEYRVDDTEQAHEVEESTDLDALLAGLSFPVMVKPCDGSGSRGASRVDSKEQFFDACKLAMNSSLTHRATVETFIVGREYGAESIVIDGEVHVLGIMRKWMTKPPYYAELGHAIPTDLPCEVEKRAKQCVKDAIRALGINFGSVNMDMIITDTGKIHIIDIGARMGGNMIGPCVIPYGTGVDYMANMLRNVAGDEIDLTPKEHGAVATRLLAFEDGIIKKLPDFYTLEKEYNVEIYHNMEVGKKVNEYHTNLDGCGYIIAKAPAVEEAIENAEKVFYIIKETAF